MNAKHTPGPWLLIDATDDEIAITTDARMADDIVPIVEVQIGWDEPLESEQRANARLIAAAPDLLEACQGLLDALPSATTHPAIKAARAAIAKATGDAE